MGIGDSSEEEPVKNTENPTRPSVLPTRQGAAHDYLCRIFFVREICKCLSSLGFQYGDTQVGKSSLISRFVSGTFDEDEPETIGYDFVRVFSDRCDFLFPLLGLLCFVRLWRFWASVSLTSRHGFLEGFRKNTIRLWSTFIGLPQMAQRKWVFYVSACCDMLYFYVQVARREFQLAYYDTTRSLHVSIAIVLTILQRKCVVSSDGYNCKYQIWDSGGKGVYRSVRIPIAFWHLHFPLTLIPPAVFTILTFQGIFAFIRLCLSWCGSIRLRRRQQGVFRAYNDDRKRLGKPPLYIS